MPRRLGLSIALAGFCLACFAQQQSPFVVRSPKVLSEQASLNVYFNKLLHAVLKASEPEFGPCIVEETKIYMEQDRSLKAVAEGNFIDIQWTMTSKQREALLRPIRVPLLKGLMGCRVFLVRKDRLADFEKVRYVQQLLPFTAGQAHDWPDTAILEHNGVRVIKGRDSVKLLKMLEFGRFDYFPRGLTEAQNELKSMPLDDVVLEPQLMLFYPAPVYFFVRKDHRELAERLEVGLEKMIDDGSFDRLFMELLAETGVLETKPFQTRRIFKMVNPLLPAETPINDQRLWWTGTRGLVNEVK